MKVVKFILNVVLSFLLMLTLICIMVLNVLNEKILNKDYVQAKIDETGFYNQLSKEIEDGFENYVYQSGLPEDTIVGLFTEDTLRNDINSIVSYVYGANEYKISEETIKSTIDSKINTYLENNNIKLNDQGKSNIENYEALVVKEYNKKIIVSEKLIELIRNVISISKKVSSMVRNYPMIVAIILGVFLVVINIKNLLVAINFAGISSLAAGLLFKIGILFVDKNIKFDSLMIYSKSTTNLFVNIAKEMLNMIDNYSNFFILCGGVAILITAILNGIEKGVYETGVGGISEDEEVANNNKKPKRRKK